MTELDRITTDRPIHGTDALGWARDEDGTWHRVEGMLAAVDDSQPPGYQTACGLDIEAREERVPTRQMPACDDCDRVAVQPPHVLA